MPPTTTKLIEEKVEAFIQHRELAGAYGYCNPTMAKKIGDFFRSSLREVALREVEEVKEIMKGKNMKGVSEINGVIFLSIQVDALLSALTKLSEEIEKIK